MTDEPRDNGAASRRRPSAPSQPQPPTDPETVPRDAEFTAFYRQEFLRLVGFLIVQGAGQISADIAQEAMAQAYRKWELLDRPGAWVRLVAQRQWWKLARHSSTEIPHDDVPEPSELLAPASYEQIENRHVLLRLLADLTELQRQVLAWSYDGYHPTEIAVVLRKDPAAVRSALRDARKKVQSGYPRGEVAS